MNYGSINAKAAWFVQFLELFSGGRWAQVGFNGLGRRITGSGENRSVAFDLLKKEG
jgi:hypothetical protein